MGTPGKYYIVDSAVLPEIFSKVVEVKELLATGEARTINEATGKVGISRSAFYKYKDAVRPFNDMLSGRIVTLRLTLRDQPGALSNVLQGIAAMGGNVLTINQSVARRRRGGGVAGCGDLSPSGEHGGAAGQYSDNERGTGLPDARGTIGGDANDKGRDLRFWSRWFRGGGGHYSERGVYRGEDRPGAGAEVHFGCAGFSRQPFADKLIKDFSIIEQDPEIDVVVETIGGAKVALDFTRRALAAGKSVVSSNKELVAQHGHELLELARENGVSYLFEASVGGGIPILHPLSQCLTANKLSEVRGILNGTTNYILTHMIGTGLSFEEALKEAQARGYAEHDPTADVEGLDACRKICILASIAFGRHVYPHQVPTKGITQVTLADVSYADAAGMKVKLLGRALRQGDKVMAYVAPHFVRDTNPLAGVEDVFNAITVRGNAIGDVMFYGRGAASCPPPARWWRT